MGFFDKLLGGGSKTPFAPDANQLAKEQELLSRYNISSPYGGRTFTTDEQGRSVLNINETPFQAQQRATREALAADYLSSLAGGDDRFAAEAKRIGDVTFERGLSRLQPVLDKARRRTEVASAARGLPVGSEARRALMDELAAYESDQYTNLAQSAELAAGNRQDQLRRLAGYEAQTFLSPELSPINQSFFNNVADVDRAEIIQEGYNQQLARAKQEAARQNTKRGNFVDLVAGVSPALGSFFGGSGGGSSMGTDIGSAMPWLMGSGGGSSAVAGLAAFSDKNLKENIKYYDTLKGFKRYIYNYIGDKTKYIGVMAQEVKDILPEAVMKEDGYYKVDYSKLGFSMEEVNA